MTDTITEQACKSAAAKIAAPPTPPAATASPPAAAVEARVRVVAGCHLPDGAGRLGWAGRHHHQEAQVRVIAGFHLPDGPGGLGEAGRHHHSEGQVQVVNSLQADVQVDHHLLAAAIQTQVEGLFEMEKHNIDLLQVR